MYKLCQNFIIIIKNAHYFSLYTLKCAWATLNKVSSNGGLTDSDAKEVMIKQLQ